MKTTQQISADCGLRDDLTEMLEDAVREPMTNYQHIIAALYRRIEKLEEKLEAYQDQLEFETGKEGI